MYQERHKTLRPYAKTEVTSGWDHTARPYSTHQTGLVRKPYCKIQQSIVWPAAAGRAPGRQHRRAVRMRPPHAHRPGESATYQGSPGVPGTPGRSGTSARSAPGAHQVDHGPAPAVGSGRSGSTPSTRPSPPAPTQRPEGLLMPELARDDLVARVVELSCCFDEDARKDVREGVDLELTVCEGRCACSTAV